MKRSYKLITPHGTTAKRFSSLIDAFRYLKVDCEDLIPSDLIHRSPFNRLQFADGYSFYRADV